MIKIIKSDNERELSRKVNIALAKGFTIESDPIVQNNEFDFPIFYQTLYFANDKMKTLLLQLESKLKNIEEEKEGLQEQLTAKKRENGAFYSFYNSDKFHVSINFSTDENYKKWENELFIINAKLSEAKEKIKDIKERQIDLIYDEEIG